MFFTSISRAYLVTVDTCAADCLSAAHRPRPLGPVGLDAERRQALQRLRERGQGNCQCWWVILS